MADLSGKTVLITAAAQGIGRASALAFAAAGARVHATDVNAAALADLRTDRLQTALLDVRDAGAVTALVAGIGPVDVLQLRRRGPGRDHPGDARRRPRPRPRPQRQGDDPHDPRRAARQARAAFIARQPIGRLGTPEEIADLAVYLAGATYTTGQAVAIDGGWTI